MNIVILAAGKGTRMRSDLPKVLHPVAGRAMLAHVIASAKSLGPSRLIIVHGHGAEKVKQAFPDANLSWALQEPQLGTGHAVAQAVELLDESVPTLVLYGDVPLISPSSLKPLMQLLASDALAVLTLTMDNPTGYGRIIRDASGHVVSIVEEKDASDVQKAVREVNTGIIAAPTQALKRWLGQLGNSNAQGEYYLTDVIAMAVADGLPVKTAQPEHDWEVLGVNSREQQATLERVYQAQQASELMVQGVTLADPARIDIRGQLSCGRDVFIDVGCVFEGQVSLADGVSVGPYCVLKDVSVQVGARLAAYTHGESATIGEGGVIGPFARLRPGTVLGKDAHVGNFVEIKNSSFGEGSKANHLAYVGDATVGARVNIGAGTITCNYDGANKHRTIIEDDAFIGSDSQLVAPVTVGQGATLGAGTTLTKDAPAGKLTVSRAKQISIEGWKRPVKGSK